MASDRIGTALRLAVVAAGSGGAVRAASDGLAATALVGTLAALWAAAVIVAGRGRIDPTAAPAPPSAPAADEQERRRLAAYLDLSPAPLVTVDARGRLRVVNRAARQLFGAADLVADPPAALLAAMAAGDSATVPIGPRGFALAVTHLAVGGDETRIAALLDIEAELRVAEATALRELLQVLHHELVNTLTPIASLGRSAADMLGEADGDPAEIRDAIETVARRAEGLQRFSASFTALARLPAPARRRFDLSLLTDDLTRLFRRRWPGVPIEADAAAVPLRPRGDPDQLQAAIWALLQNAAEATDGRPAARVTLAVDTTPALVRIAVSDTGPGVPAADRERIFRAFVTGKAEGSGIGLALARQVMRAHGGELSLAEDGRPGATFVACWPG